MKTRIKRIALGFLIATVFTPLLGYAQNASLSPFSGEIIDDGNFDGAITGSLQETSRVTVVNPIKGISITARLKTLGNITFYFNREWHVPAAVSFQDNGFALTESEDRGMHLQGYAIVRSASASGRRIKRRVPVAATVYHITSSKPTLEAEFQADAHGDGGHFYQVKTTLHDKAASHFLKVRRVSRQAFPGKTCGLLASNQKTTIESAPIKSRLSVLPIKTSAVLTFDIATEADYEWYARYGSSSNTKIQSILNKTQTIYENQLNLSLSLKKQVVITSSGSRYTSSDVDTLLDNFRTYSESHDHLGSADAYHLFTGKDTFIDDNGTQNSSVIGLAYLGVVCAFPTYSYGLTEDLDDALNHVTTAHELGHNFNAQHDAAGSIMGTALDLGNPPTTFSNSSKSQIASFVSDNSSCLSSGSATPTPTPTSGGGGSGTNPGQGDTSHVGLTMSLNSKGKFTVTTTFSELDSSCTAELRASTRSGSVYNGAGTLLASIDPNYTITKFTKVPVNRAGAKKIYFGVTKTCGDTTYYSATKSVNPTKVTSTKPTLGASSWLKLLANKVKVATPARF